MTIKEFVVQWKLRMKSFVDEHPELLPSLTIIQVGDVEASNRYVKHKLKDCEEVGIKANLVKLPETATTMDVCKEVVTSRSDGIIVQLPLPDHINLDVVVKYLPTDKDVDGFKQGSKFTPCTPGGIIEYLEEEKFEFDRKLAVVIGRSDIVGKPMTKLLLDRNCTVVQCHSHTKESDLKALLRMADLVVCAAGKRGVIKSSDAPNAFIVDVGINFDENGKLCGDVINDNNSDRVTPVPGGVGLLTRCKLLNNIINTRSLNIVSKDELRD